MYYVRTARTDTTPISSYHIIFNSRKGLLVVHMDALYAAAFAALENARRETPKLKTKGNDQATITFCG